MKSLSHQERPFCPFVTVHYPIRAFASDADETSLRESKVCIGGACNPQDLKQRRTKWNLCGPLSDVGTSPPGLLDSVYKIVADLLS
jgi:hypothetical protein